VDHGKGGTTSKTAVGKVHTRQPNGTYSVDLMNGARKVNICNARQCDPKLLEEELKSEQGMVTHKDAYASMHDLGCASTEEQPIVHPVVDQGRRPSSARQRIEEAKEIDGALNAGE
jgi:hypothetical protein